MGYFDNVFHWAGPPTQAQFNAELTLKILQNQMKQQAYFNNLYNNLSTNPNLFSGLGSTTNNTQTSFNGNWSQIWNNTAP